MHLLAFGTLLALVAPVVPPSPPQPDSRVTVALHETRVRDALTVGLDAGRSVGQGILAPSIGLLHLDGLVTRGPDGKIRGGLGATVWLGYGGEFRLLVPQEGPVGGQVSGKAKASVLGDAGGTSFEVALGGARLPGGPLRATGSVGAAISFLYADVGYAYQIPLDGGARPFGLASHQFTLRITLPVANGPTKRILQPVSTPGGETHGARLLPLRAF
jgi:hypothetical protein